MIVSQHANVKLREVAEATTVAATGQLGQAERQEPVAATMQTHQASHKRGSAG
ncbi:hypothetical protein [Streptomyces acidicola]|uniref:hypothetical protein n=1 Tax=Streptomyces acidicola TaxID=2596892 RepID=UPI00380701E5